MVTTTFCLGSYGEGSKQQKPPKKPQGVDACHGRMGEETWGKDAGRLVGLVGCNADRMAVVLVLCLPGPSMPAIQRGAVGGLGWI